MGSRWANAAQGVCTPPAQCLVAGPLIRAKLGRPIGFMLGELAQAQQRLVLPRARQALAFKVRRGAPGGICSAEDTHVGHVAQASEYEGSWGSTPGHWRHVQGKHLLSLLWSQTCL